MTTRRLAAILAADVVGYARGERRSLERPTDARGVKSLNE
jgi:hypothetical protein